MRTLLMACSVLLLVCPAGAQVAAAPDLCADGPRPAFDVVSVKPAQTPANGWMRRSSDGLTFTGSLDTVIRYAYNLQRFQLSGGPGWISSTDWEIRAKSDSPDPDFAQLDDAQRQALWNKHMRELQSVLLQRFHFKCHMIEKQLPVYELVVTKGGSKLKESRAEAGSRSDISVRVNGYIEHATGRGVGIARIAMLLAGPTGRLVIDKTGLEGSYDFALEWADASPAGVEAGPDARAAASIYTAVEEQLGLKLQPGKSEVPVMVIDQAETPTEN